MRHTAPNTARTRVIAGFGVVAAALLAVAHGPGIASAGEYVAIVEDVRAAGIEHRYMDYIAPGTVIALAPGERLIIGYLGSCLRETITGGTVVVGRSRGTVTGGTVRRERVECDGGQILLTAEEAAKSGVLVFRAAPVRRSRLTIHGTSPIVKVTGGAKQVTIVPLDRNTGRFTLPVADGSADLLAANHALAPGGMYRAGTGKRSIVFRVDEHAVAGRAPVISRLVPL